MKAFIQTIIVLTFFFTISASKLHASHVMGADIRYVCLGGDSFLVRLSLYRDCWGILPSTTAAINIVSASCNLSLLAPTLTLAPGTVTEPNPRELSVLCPSQVPLSTCNGGTLPGMEVWIYEDILVLPAQCPDWIISFELCCRTDSVSNLVNPAAYDLYTEATLNNAGGLCNNSPIFTQNTFFVCNARPVTLNIGAVDIDGDSLHFTSINPLAGSNEPIPYYTPFSPTTPVVTSDSFLLNPQTGQMTFTPSAEQVAVVTVLVNEYRNGTFIGSTIYDIQIVVSNCTNSPPVISGIQGTTGGTVIDSSTITVCPGQNLTFSFSVSDADVLDILTINAPNVSVLFPAGTMVFSGGGNNYSGTFSWTASGADVGTHYLAISVQDDACPLVGNSSSLFKIFVIEGTSAGADRYYCPAGGPVQLSASGGTSFTWSPAGGLSNSLIQNPLASPVTNTDYIVTSNLTGGCGNTDTVTVYVVPDFTLITSPDATICLNGTSELLAMGGAQGAPYNYVWSPAGSLLNSTSANPIAAPVETTTYSVAVTASTGCVMRDSVTVFVSGFAPRVQITSDRNSVCPGDSVQLNTELFSLQCGATSAGCSAQNLPVPKTFGGNGAANFATPFAGGSEDSRFQSLYRASDLIAAGISQGTITRIDLEVGSKSSTSFYQNLTIKMGCTSDDVLSTTQGFLTGGIIVTGPLMYPTSFGVNSFPFSMPFDWDGVSNLFIEICYDNPDSNSAGGDDQLLTSSVGYTASMRRTDNNTDGCMLAPTFTYPRVPQITFHICSPLTSQYTYSWSPAIGLSNPNILNPKAAFQQATLYSLAVYDTGSACTGTGFITLQTDTSYGIDASVAGAICGGGSIPLSVAETGTPPVSTLQCGTNASACSTPLQTRQVGLSSTSTTVSTPYKGFWHDSRVQILYTVADLQAAGISGSSTIREIAFNVVSKGSTMPYNGFTIKMGCTSLATLPAAFVSSATLATVYGPINYSTVAGWNTHALTNAYDWDGVSNIIVEVCFDNTAYTNYDDIGYTTSLGSTVIYDHQDFDAGCNLTLPTTSTFRPNTRFTFCPAPPGNVSIAWTPANTLSDSAIPNPIASPTITTTYHVSYTFINGCTKYDSVTVVVNSTSFNATVSDDTTVCTPNSNVPLIASGGTGYEWDSVPGLSCYICANPVASPASSSVYSVRVSDSTSGCSDYESVIITVAQPPVIQISNDSILCEQASVILDAGAGYSSYQWLGGETTQTISVNNAGQYTVHVLTNGLCFAADTVLVFQESDCVWPGDVNHDGIANNYDVLSLGIAYGTSGPARLNQAITWEARSAPSWSQAFANGANYKHADCFGNGLIDELDTFAVSLNYGLTHNKTGPQGMPGDPVLYFQLADDTAREGDLLFVPVFLGRDTLLVDDFYGIAFTINYDNSIVEGNAIRFDPYNSFAGSLGNDLMSFTKNLASDSKLDAALARTNQSTVSGRGQIGMLEIKIKDAINWNGAFVKELYITFGEIKAIDEQENDISISAEPAKIYVVREPVGTNEKVIQPEIIVYPNPSNNSVFIRANKEMNMISLLDILGRELFIVNKIAGNNYSMDLSDIKNGNYMMKVRLDNKEVVKKIVVLK